MEISKTNVGNCDDAINELVDNLVGSRISSESFKEFINKHRPCEKALQEIYSQWQDLELITVPEPRAEMHANFYKTLNEFTSTKQRDSKSSIWVQYVHQLIVKHAAAILLFVVGLSLGLLLKSPNNSKLMAENLNNTEFNSNDITLAKSSLQKISEIQGFIAIKQPDKSIFEALNQALLYDPNTNVRLSAIESMLHFVDNPVVRQNLILAIPYQVSPIVQLTLAEVMINLEEKGSAESWKKLLESKSIEHDVKKQLQETLKEII